MKQQPLDARHIVLRAQLTFNEFMVQPVLLSCLFFVCVIQLASIPGLEDVTVSTPAPAPSGSAASTSAQATAPPPPPSDTPQTAAEVQ